MLGAAVDEMWVLLPKPVIVLQMRPISTKLQKRQSSFLLTCVNQTTSSVTGPAATRRTSNE